MLNWYSDLYAKIKWNNQLSKAIPILKGTRQDRLSSPELFNMFYKSLIDKLNSSTDGIIIDKQIYDALCYADDVMLMSTTVTGLQSLINTAVKHITDRGLSFNSQKTECYINGKNPFMRMPEWFINDDKLKICQSILSILGLYWIPGRDSHMWNRALVKPVRLFTVYRVLASTIIQSLLLQSSMCIKLQFSLDYSMGVVLWTYLKQI